MIRAALTLSLALTCTAQGVPPGGWLCIGSKEFTEAAKPLIAHRTKAGLRVTVAEGPAATAIAACEPRPAYILILGDEVRGPVPDDSDAWHISSARRPYHGWKPNHPREFVSDMALGDYDGDGVPDASVGRIPARAAADVTAAVEKILRWEKRTPSLQDLTLPVWAGDPGFNTFFRNAALGFLCGQIRERSPLWAELWILQGDERSPFCGWPEEQTALFNQRLTQGGVLSAMIGHGRPGGWWSMDSGGQKLEYVVQDTTTLSTVQPSPPHIIFACSTGRFSLPEGTCLTEAMFRAPGGPVLCVGATEDSHPLTNYYHSTALLRDLSDGEPAFGDLWLRSLRDANATTEPDKELLVRTLEPFFIQKSLTTAEIRADHGLLYNIIGDPATRVFVPQRLHAEISEKEGQWHWEVKNPPAGARLLVQRRAPLPEFGLTGAAPGKEDGLKRLAAANAKMKFETTTELPAGGPWKGSTEGGGTLRLVAISPDRIAVAAAAAEGPMHGQSTR